MSELREFNILGDERGQLVALEQNRQVPFDIKGYFIYTEHRKGFHVEIIPIIKQSSFWLQLTVVVKLLWITDTKRKPLIWTNLI